MLVGCGVRRGEGCGRGGVESLSLSLAHARAPPAPSSRGVALIGRARARFGEGKARPRCCSAARVTFTPVAVPQERIGWRRIKRARRARARNDLTAGRDATPALLLSSSPIDAPNAYRNRMARTRHSPVSQQSRGSDLAAVMLSGRGARLVRWHQDAVFRGGGEAKSFLSPLRVWCLL